jgi:hypothetical protein
MGIGDWRIGGYRVGRAFKPVTNLIEGTVSEEDGEPVDDGNIVEELWEGVKDVGGDVYDKISDPTGQKAAAAKMADIYGRQFAEQQRLGEQWRGFTQPGAHMGRSAMGQYLGSDPYANMPHAYGYRGRSPVEYQQWTGADLGSDPGYQFRLKEGLGAIERGAAAGSGSLGTATDKAMMEYASGLASQEADRAFGRHMGEFGARRRVKEWEDPFAAQQQQQFYQNQMGQWGLGRDEERNLAQMGMSAMGQYSPYQQMAMQAPVYSSMAQAAGLGQRPAFWDYLGMMGNLMQGAGGLAGAM